ncbi:MAG TPA: hypothetical protein VG406_07710 [Isosphaeraceae bacterium]|nr:hypothetical protein [Isosphaeraceae bacterium]
MAIPNGWTRSRIVSSGVGSATDGPTRSIAARIVNRTSTDPMAPIVKSRSPRRASGGSGRAARAPRSRSSSRLTQRIADRRLKKP